MILDPFFAQHESDETMARIKERTMDKLDGLIPTTKDRTSNQRKTMIQGILPVISLYEALQELGHTKSGSYQIVEEYLTNNLGKALNKKMRKMEQLPLFFRFFGKLTSLALWKNDGWEISRIVADKNEISYNVFRCIYRDTCMENGCIELCKLFCELDTIAYTDLRKLVFLRTKTLATDSECCDFLFRRK